MNRVDLNQANDFGSLVNMQRLDYVLPMCNSVQLLWVAY